MKDKAAQVAIMSRMRLANASIANGFVTISMPGARKPFAIDALAGRIRDMIAT